QPLSIPLAGGGAHALLRSRSALHVVAVLEHAGVSRSPWDLGAQRSALHLDPVPLRRRPPRAPPGTFQREPRRAPADDSAFSFAHDRGDAWTQLAQGRHAATDDGPAAARGDGGLHARPAL